MRRLFGYATLLTLVGLAALPIAVAAAPVNRPMVIRLAAAVVLAIVLVDIRGGARAALDEDPSSPRGRLGWRRPAARPSIDRQFTELLDDVRFGPVNHRYWTRVAWPRLSRLAERLPGRPQLAEPARSRIRWLLGRGPSFTQVRDLVARLEERR